MDRSLSLRIFVRRHGARRAGQVRHRYGPKICQSIALQTGNIHIYLGFRKTEKDPDCRYQAAARPEECGLRTPVPCSRAQLVIRHYIDKDVAGIISCSRQHNRFGLESCRGEFGYKRVCYRPHCEVIDESEDNQQGPDCPGGAVRFSKREGAYDYQNRELRAETTEMDLASSHFAHEEPRPCCADHSKSVLSHGQRE